MEANVLDWEPELALFVPDEDPLRFYRRIAELGRELLRPGGKLYFEINQAYGQDMIRIDRNEPISGRSCYKRHIWKKIEYLQLTDECTINR